VNRIAIAVLYLMGWAGMVAAGDGDGAVSTTSAFGMVERVRIVEVGQPRACIVVRDQSDKVIMDAAELLVYCVKSASGAELPRRDSAPEECPTGSVTIVLESVIAPGSEGGELPGADEEAFIIQTGCDGCVRVRGRTSSGVANGVAEFLERYIGVRWLLPGPLGEDIPRCETIDIPVETICDEPRCLSRYMSGLGTREQSVWGVRNRMRRRIEFHHNMSNLFPPEKYGTSHPEFYPVYGGQRYVPASGVRAWDICYSATGIVDAAVATISAWFDKNPDVNFYSLGRNDSAAVCQCEPCRQSRLHKPINFVARGNVSDMYYDWCNRVIEGVLKKHPDKWFGTLAYLETAEIPVAGYVHPRLVPFLTHERLGWIDAGTRAKYQAYTKSWHAAAPMLGWYDYIYGNGYILPRVWFHHMADTYRWGYEQGVRAHYAEAYPITWLDAPKLYLWLKLTWNPKADVDVLLRDWYERAVGVKAADELAAFYAHWEDYWTRRIMQSAWFRPDGLLGGRNSLAYMDVMTDEDLLKSCRWLDGAVEKADTPARKARAVMLRDAFKYADAVGRAYLFLRPYFADPIVETPAQAVARLDVVEQFFDRAATGRQRLLEHYEKYPIFAQKRVVPQGASIYGRSWSTVMWGLAGQARHPQVRERLERLASASSHEMLRQCCLNILWFASDFPPQPVSNNPSFEDGQGMDAAGWSYWTNHNIGEIVRCAEAARTGEQGLRIKGLQRGGPSSSIVFTKPGRYAVLVHLRTLKPLERLTHVELVVTLVGENDRVVFRDMAVLKPSGRDWQPLALLCDAPESQDGRAVKRMSISLIVDNMAPEDELHVDDFALYRLADTPGAGSRQQ